MRLREIINEDSGAGDSGDDSGSNPGTGGTKGGKRGKMHPHHASAIKGMTTYPEFPGWYYNMYRFGVDMAGNQHEDHNYVQQSHSANELSTYAYTEADKLIIDKSKKNMGVKGKTLTSNKSEEPDGINKHSPVAKIKKNKYGI